MQRSQDICWYKYMVQQPHNVEVTYVLKMKHFSVVEMKLGSQRFVKKKFNLTVADQVNCLTLHAVQREARQWADGSFWPLG